MSYDSRGELVELSITESDPKQEEDIYEKSNIFKKSDFVTKSKFSQTHNGILTKHNFTTREPPPQNSKFSFDFTKDYPNYSYINSLFNKGPDYIQAAVLFDDATNPQASAFNSTYGTYDNFEKFESTKQRPTVAFFTTTPAPTSIIPIIVTQPTVNNKKTKKKTKPKKTPPNMPAASEIHEHIMKNLEFYREVLRVKCTPTKAKENESNYEEIDTVEVTPRPIPVNDKDIRHKDKDKVKNI